LPIPTNLRTSGIVDKVTTGAIADSTAAFAAVNSLTSAHYGLQELNVLHARFACRDTAPVPIVVLGSSTAGGQGATSDPRAIANRFVIGVQTDYPLTSGAAQPAMVTLSTGMTLPVGIQHIKAATSGSNSGTYVTSTMLTQIGALNPAALVHMIGSNDYSINMPPSTTYKTNVLTTLDQLDAQITVPHVHILVQNHRRTNGSNPTYPWSAYGQALKDIAESRDGVIFIDLSTAYAAAKTDSTDPLGMMNADKIHLNDNGHALGADLLRGIVRANPMTVAPFVALPDGATVTPVITNSTAPSISGTGTTGQTLTSSTGTWNVTPDSYAYQWRRAGSAISGATAATYVLVQADEGQAITCAVTAVKSGYTSATTVTSNNITPVASAAAAVLTSTTAPTISGTPTTGQALTTTNGSWSATPDNYSYAWKRDGVTISGATSIAYVLVTADEGHAISSVVTATKTSYTSGTAVSANSITPSAAAATPALSNTTAPAISGTATTGQTLTASTGSWSTTPDSYTYQWNRAGSPISGATSATYVLVTADEGLAVTVTVTAVKSGYTSVSVTSSSVTSAVTSGGGGTSDLTSGLIFDFDADSVSGTDGSLVPSWSSTTGSAGTLAATQSTTANQPTLVASAINGHKAIRFTASATTRLLTSNTAPVIAGTSVSYVYVIKRTGASTRLIGGVNSSGYHTLADPNGVNGLTFGIEALSGNVLTYTVSVLNRWIIVIVSAAGASSKMVIGNEATVTGTLNTSSATGVSMGGSGSGSGYGTFDLSRYRAYDHALTDTEIATLKANFNSRYALS
jgi:lysophospholipase L1-like esterase